MSQHAEPTPGRPSHAGGGTWSQRSADAGSWVTGGVAFAGVLLLLSGALAVLQGGAAIAENDVYASVGGYVYRMNLTGWGIVHVVVGALAFLTGLFLLRGDAAWARIAGITFASLSLFAQFLFLPYQPIWSVTVMAIDVFIIWALASRHGLAARS